jgi:hypothetical protein
MVTRRAAAEQTLEKEHEEGNAGCLFQDFLAKALSPANPLFSRDYSFASGIGGQSRRKSWKNA